MNATTDTSPYVFDTSLQRELDRMRGIEALFDHPSERLLAARGVGPGWRCLEVGCGAGGVATWLARRVGADGHVLAIDLDTRFVDPSGLDNLELRQQNLVSGELEEASFDLAHARAVLEHIPERDFALERLIAALKPGGWLVLEDVHFGGPAGATMARYMYPPSFADTWERLGRAIEIVFAAAGADASLGPRLPGLFKEAGLVNVGAEVHTPVVQGGSDPFMPLTIEQLSGRLLETGLVREEDIQAFLTLTRDPDSFYLPPLMVSAWGQRL
jgi:SAM-dependent methyltransferase